ncbi:MAG: hypothetical protein WC552_04635 [Candidatus Omnitrophota bacterium]
MKTKVFFILTFVFLLWCRPAYSQAARKDGLHRQYYPTGELQYELNYKDGKLDGPGREYGKDGKIIREYSFRADEIVDEKMLNQDWKELGPLRIFFTLPFWIVVLVIGGLVWLIFVKIAFHERPY